MKLPKGRTLTHRFVMLWHLATGVAFTEAGAVLEHRFHATRKWRFDIAWPEKKLAVELHGGTWQQGRHQRGAGFTRDREKMRAAVLNGWRVLEYTDEDLRQSPAQVIEEVQRALGS